MASDQFESLLEQADQTAQSGDWSATFTTLLQAQKIQPNHAGVINGLGACLIQLQKFPEAIPYFQKLVGLAPDSAEAFNNLGVALAMTGQYVEAENAYRQALNLDNTHLSAWKNLAQAYMQQADRLREGIEILQALVQSYPNDAEALFMMGNCYEIGEDIASARQLYELALQNRPDYSEAQEALERLAQKQLDPNRIAKPEHAQKLASLKSLNTSTSPESKDDPSKKKVNPG